MEASIPDVDSADSPGSQASSSSSLLVSEQPNVQFGRSDFNDDMDLGFVPDVALTNMAAAELTEFLSGDANHVNNNNNNVAPAPSVSHLNPSALLNPRSANSKRPASSGGDADRGRPDSTIAGQVSLVERLHNVQERTASPAKRVKTEEDRKKTANRQGFGGGSALELQRTNGQVPPLSGPAIDLTMSEYILSRACKLS
jgi:hypothetical protein